MNIYQTFFCDTQQQEGAILRMFVKHLAIFTKCLTKGLKIILSLRDLVNVCRALCSHTIDNTFLSPEQF